jgi:hypothetical protein
MNGEGDDLWNLIRMERFYSLFQFGKKDGFGFDEKDIFLVYGDAFLPPVE